jgi:anti-sigma factor RsiW
MSAERNIDDTELLSAYIDGQMTTEERLALEARLQTDTELRRQLALLRATVDLIKNLPPLAVPRDFRLTRAMVNRGLGNRRIYTFSLLSAAAAVVLLVVGFGLLTAQLASSPTRGVFSNTVSNPVHDGDQQGIAQLPIDTLLDRQPLTTIPPTTGYFAAGEEPAENAAETESEIAMDAAQQAQATTLPVSPGRTPTSATIIVAPAMASTAEIADISGTTNEEYTSTDQRLRDTQQAEPLSEAPVSAPPFEPAAQPTQGAAGALAFQPSLQPPTSTPFPTTLPTETPKPTETPSRTPTNTQMPTSTPAATMTPVPPLVRSTPMVSTGTTGSSSLSCVILLVASLSISSADGVNARRHIAQGVEPAEGANAMASCPVRPTAITRFSTTRKWQSPHCHDGDQIYW